MDTRRVGRGLPLQVQPRPFDPQWRRHLRVAVVLNPVRRRARLAQDLLLARVAEFGWPRPLVLPTTPGEPGGPQTRAAIAWGAELIVVIGGDGTLRQVAQAIVEHAEANSRPELGIVPVGTANLVARNVQLPRRLRTCVDIALGLSRAAGLAQIDVGRAEMETRRGVVRETFLVLAGIGRDALTVDMVSDKVKHRLGWPAYFGPALTTMLARPAQMRWQIDDAEPRTDKVWSILAANCARIPAGIRIAPDSLLDDGVAETLIVTAQTPREWAVIAAKGVLDWQRPVPGLEHGSARRLVIEPAQRQPVQLDGDVHTGVSRLTIEIDRAALAVRVRVRPAS